MLPQFTARSKWTAMLLFAASLALIFLGGISYYNIGSDNKISFFGMQGYGVILISLLLFVITAPFVHSKIRNITNIYIVGLGVLAIISVYFLATKTSLITGFISHALVAVAAATPVIQIREKIIHFR